MDPTVRFRSSHERCFVKKVYLEILQTSQETPVPEALSQVFSSEFCAISKNTFFIEHLLTTASADSPLEYPFQIFF